jgi:hypothetical protein
MSLNKSISCKLKTKGCLTSLAIVYLIVRKIHSNVSQAAKNLPFIKDYLNILYVCQAVMKLTDAYQLGFVSLFRGYNLKN